VPNVYTLSLEALIPEAKAQGLDPRILAFSDWKTPNLALQSGDIVNYFQHRAFLDIARIAEVSLREVDGGLIEAAQATGCHRWHIVRRVLLPEALPGIVGGLTITVVSVIGASAMAGAVGSGVGRHGHSLWLSALRHPGDGDRDRDPRRARLPDPVCRRLGRSAFAGLDSERFRSRAILRVPFSPNASDGLAFRTLVII